MPTDGRVGASDVMAVAAEVCEATGADGLYDCSAGAAALRAAAG